MYNARAVAGGFWANLGLPLNSADKRTVAHRQPVIKMSSAIDITRADAGPQTWAGKTDEELLMEASARKESGGL